MRLKEIIALRAVFTAVEKALNEAIFTLEYSQASAAAQTQIEKASAMLEEVWDIMSDLDTYETICDGKGVNTWESE